mmetsp:Transcript_51805/g.150469  ORF Transcript_51805/g.150469 Transcript_51805/m.150469 type:complete len:483 (+) Transcript_51805:3-1451(+)
MAAATQTSPRGMEECFFANGAKYDPVNMRGEDRSTEENVEACQGRCASVAGCAHFSFWNDGGCHLQDSGAELVQQSPGTLAGPPRWPAHCRGDPPLEAAAANQTSQRDMDACFFVNGAKYEPLSMPGEGRSTEDDAEACQRRCAGVAGCAHFSFWDDGGCHLQDAGAGLVRLPLGTLAGPPRWPPHCRSDPLLVRNLVTFGAPAVSYPPLTNPGGRCIPGLRVYTENNHLTIGLPGKESDAAAMTTNFPHVKTPVLVLRGEGDSPSIYEGCPGKPRWPIFGVGSFHDWGIHGLEHYKERLTRLNVKGFSKAVMKVHLAQTLMNFTGFTYDWTLDNIRKDLQSVPGWNLVGYMDHLGFGEDVDRVLVMQRRRSKECVIAFQGSQGAYDLSSFLKSGGTGFCGFGNTHTGVRNELWRLTADEKYALHVKPKLAKCAAVDCVGHSLGGALCNLFAACANSGRAADPDYRQLAWRPAGEPELLEEV